MRSIKIVNGKGRTVAVTATCAILALAAARSHAGSLTPPAGPAAAGSAMYTIGDVYQRLSSGAAGTKRTGTFVEPTDLGATMHTLDEVMALAPALEPTNGAAVIEVCSGKYFWGLRSGGWGRLSGTGACPPIFLNAYGPFSVTENSISGDVGTPVTATGSGIAYSIFAGDPTGVFTIGSSTGQITLSGTGTIDYETTRSYSLTVRATIGTTTRDVRVTVNVTGVDDEAPVFLTSGPFRVAESSGANTVIGTVVAVDPDTAAGGLTYTITGGNTGGHFRFDSTTPNLIEAANNLGGAASYTLTVQVSDGATHSDTATVDITVLDVAP